MARTQNINLKSVEKLLNQQTVIILGAVDKKLNKFEQRLNKKIDKLITTVDKFVNLYTEQKQEFEIIKYEINKIKKVIKEKLGVEIS